MVKIRLRRVGTKHQPSYRVVVADSQRAQTGSIVDSVGIYNPKANPPILQIDEEKVISWIRKGAQPSDSVAQLLRKLGTVEKAKAKAS
ncbi:MAG: 30S ribosomal protein S16 [Dehalococcoidia bacterium]|nr:30S ribosomal protein S16 [Dehalococcoidia bacterium]